MLASPLSAPFCPGLTISAMFVLFCLPYFFVTVWSCSAGHTSNAIVDDELGAISPSPVNRQAGHCRSRIKQCGCAAHEVSQPNSIGRFADYHQRHANHCRRASSSFSHIPTLVRSGISYGRTVRVEIVIVSGALFTMPSLTINCTTWVPTCLM